MGRRFEGTVQAGYGVGSQVMADPVLAARQAHHFRTFKPVPGTLNVRLAERFDTALFTGTVTEWELGGYTEDHHYRPVRIEGSIPGLVVQTANPGGDFPARVVELIADRHLRTALGLSDGHTIAFELDDEDADPAPWS
jgi:CTP-dependent riboflavin kinase